MNHYDGPAFYRKFVHDGTVNKNNKLNALRAKKQQYFKRSAGVTGFSRDVQRADFNNFRPVKTKASHIDLQDNPIARITANFKPRKHYGTPDRTVTYASSEANEFETINRHFHRLTSELTPSDSSVTLMASSSQNSNNIDSSSQREGSLHFKLVSSPNTEASERSDQKQGTFNRISVNSTFSSVDNQRSNHGSRLDYDESQFSNTNSSKSVTNENSNVNIPKSKFSRFNGTSLGKDKTSEASRISRLGDEPSRISSTSDGVKSSSETDSSRMGRIDQSNSDSEQTESRKINDQSSMNSSKGPLGHDFSSIMHDEGEDIKKNLTLFKDSDSSIKSNEELNNLSNQDQSSNNDSSQSGDLNNISEKPAEDRAVDSNGTHNEDSNDSSEVLGNRPNFVAQNPTNVQPSSDFDDSDSSEEEHHNIQPSVIKDYKFPSHQLLVAPKHDYDRGLDNWILDKAETLNKTLKAFNVNAQVVDWTNGPTVTQFQVKLQLGVKVSKINHLSDDLKMALAAKDIRIQAPIPGKTTCGIEIPNPKPRPVMLSEVVNSKTFRNSKSDLTIALGVDLTGKPRVTDLRKMPHGLIAGATGSGKSVFINCMLISLMYKATPQELKMILIDPKAVEFAPYNGIPYLLSPVISEPKQAAASLKWATKEMNQRYEKLAAAGVRNIEQFNQKADQNHKSQMKMPYILIVIDELADLMMVAGDEIETYIVRITQKARAAGIHLVVATQRPSVDVITGTMKNNIPTRVAFMVSSQVDSRTIIDQSGAERLLGKGDMLFLGNGSSHPIRLQGCFVSNKEIDQVAKFARHQEPAHYAFHPGSLLKHVSRLENQDKLMPQVLAYIAKEKTVSTSKLQRVFSIGYNRSAKIIDSLEQHGYISGQEGSKPRDVYLTEKDYKKLNL